MGVAPAAHDIAMAGNSSGRNLWIAFMENYINLCVASKCSFMVYKIPIEKNLNKDFAYNCEIILSKLLSHRMIDNTTNWGRGTEVDNQNIENYLKKAVASALNQCSKFTDEIKTACNEDLALMSVFVTQSQKDLQIIYCKNFKGPLQQKCLSAKPE